MLKNETERKWEKNEVEKRDWKKKTKGGNNEEYINKEKDRNGINIENKNENKNVRENEEKGKFYSYKIWCLKYLSSNLSTFFLSHTLTSHIQIHTHKPHTNTHTHTVIISHTCAYIFIYTLYIHIRIYVLIYVSIPIYIHLKKQETINLKTQKILIQTRSQSHKSHIRSSILYQTFREKPLATVQRDDDSKWW